MADGGELRERQCTKGQGLLRREGPPNIRYFIAKLGIVAIYAVWKGRYRAFYKSHPALGMFSTKVSLLLKGFQQKVSLLLVSFWRAFVEPAFKELLESPLSESSRRAFVEPAFRELSENGSLKYKITQDILK